MNQFIGLGEVGIDEFFAVLVQDRTPRLLEEDVVARVALLKLGSDLLLEIVIGVFGFPQAVSQDLAE